MPSPIVTKFRNTVVPALAAKHFFDATLTTFTTIVDPDTGTVIQNPLAVAVKAMPPFSRKKMESSDTGRTEQARTIIPALGLTVEPPLGSTLLIGAELWLIMRVDALPDDGTAAMTNVAAFKMRIER